ncbi:cation transporter dimerization domain-containing protein [Dietzia sp. 2505]|uniref:cation transporter dimerization domain-containing protein n=1 Tax=Dietzia sp. 2505 TaxID=3156457 RepID=UPI0033956DC6
MPAGDMERFSTAQTKFSAVHGVFFAPARTVETGRHRHIYLVMGVPGSWAVSTAHELADRLEDQVEGVFPGRDTHPCRAGGSTRLLLTPQCGCSRRADVHGLVV